MPSSGISYYQRQSQLFVTMAVAAGLLDHYKMYKKRNVNTSDF